MPKRQTKIIMRTTLFFLGTLAVCIIGAVLTLIYASRTCPKTDYYLNIDQSDSFYLLDKKGDTIYVEKFNFEAPTRLQAAIINDNL